MREVILDRLGRIEGGAAPAGVGAEERGEDPIAIGESGGISSRGRRRRRRRRRWGGATDSREERTRKVRSRNHVPGNRP